MKEQTRNQRVCKRDGILDRGSSDDEHEQDRKRAKQQEKVNTGEKTRAKERNQRMHGQGAARTGSSHVAKERGLSPLSVLFCASDDIPPAFTGRPRERPSSARQGSRRKRVDEVCLPQVLTSLCVSYYSQTPCRILDSSATKVVTMIPAVTMPRLTLPQNVSDVIAARMLSMFIVFTHLSLTFNS